VLCDYGKHRWWSWSFCLFLRLSIVAWQVCEEKARNWLVSVLIESCMQCYPFHWQFLLWYAILQPPSDFKEYFYDFAVILQILQLPLVMSWHSFVGSAPHVTNHTCCWPLGLELSRKKFCWSWRVIDGGVRCTSSIIGLMDFNCGKYKLFPVCMSWYGYYPLFPSSSCTRPPSIFWR
jgi:hypothetical protein